jgi:RHS repeat-associated protein
VAARTPEGTTFFFGAFDWRAGTVVRYVRAGDRLVAASPVSDNQIFARHAQPAPPLMLAKVVGGVPALALLGVGLAVWRGRRARPLGPLPRGSAALVAAVFYLATLPLLSPAHAQCPVDPTKGPPPPGTLFYHTDHLATLQLLTNESGQVVERLVHRPYGAVGGVYDPAGFVLAESRSPYLFTGHRADDGTGLIYMGARYFEPGLGMFVSHDPAAQFFSHTATATGTR